MEFYFVPSEKVLIYNERVSRCIEIFILSDETNLTPGSILIFEVRVYSTNARRKMFFVGDKIVRPHQKVHNENVVSLSNDTENPTILDPHFAPKDKNENFAHLQSTEDPFASTNWPARCSLGHFVRLQFYR